MLALACARLFSQTQVPEWCRALPRPEYRTLQRVPVSDAWFEVYEVARGVFAVYEPHQFEETISYLILGKKQALLFDTGMGISDLKKVVTELTHLPILVLNSHTHNDHVGSNWQFERIYGMDTDFTRQNARGSRIRSEKLCDTTLEDYVLHARWGSHRPGRPPTRSSCHARSHPGCDFPFGSCQWPALHGRYVLPRADLAVPAGNRSGRLRSFYSSLGGAGARTKTGSRRSQYSGGLALCAASTGDRLRSSTCG